MQPARVRKSTKERAWRDGRKKLVEAVGRVAAIHRFPVKSMAGERLDSIEVDWQGFEGDRQYSFYRTGDRSRFPWLTGRELPDLVRFQPRFTQPQSPRTSSVEIATPDGEKHDLFAPELLERLAQAVSCALGVLQSGRGLYDAMPVSIATTATHQAVDDAFGAPLDARRFRSNLLIESDHREGEWKGRRLSFGRDAESAELLVADAIPRCAMITIDPDSALRSPPIMRLVAEQFDNMFGVYATPARLGRIRSGDSVFLID